MGRGIPLPNFGACGSIVKHILAYFEGHRMLLV